MKRERIKYLILILITIFLGLMSREIPHIPLFIGDVLWAVMVFFIIRFIFIKAKIKSVVIMSLIFCYLIEISQLYQAEWINNIRKTLLGRLILGQGFLWSDIISYTVGVSLVSLFDRRCKR